MANVTPKIIASNTHNVYKGAVVENYVVSQLIMNHNEMYYYKPSDSMEIDLLLSNSSIREERRSYLLINVLQQMMLPQENVFKTYNNLLFEQYILS